MNREERTLPDEQLAHMIAEGDGNAFNTLASRYLPELRLLLLKLTQDGDVADDLVQEVLLKAYLALSRQSYAEKQKVKGWLLTIAKNSFLDHRRRERRRNSIVCPMELSSLQVADEASEQLQLVYEKEQRLDLVEASLPHLVPAQREVVSMRLKEMSFAQISEAMACSLGTSLARMSYAVHNLRSLCEQRVA